ncbi:MAG: hypothetical protein NZ578_02945 [Candidatus Binatia bacterium]|nr:hypothetical protein [Candidatus Binatia bacterium]
MEIATKFHYNRSCDMCTDGGQEGGIVPRTTSRLQSRSAPVLWSDVVPLLRHLRTFAAQLLHQQLWCWGQDICFPRGNLLLSYGLTRTRPPVPTAGSSHYQGEFHEAALSLWGFGVFCGHPQYGGLFLQRYTWTFAWTPHSRLSPPVWTPADLPSVSAPRTPLTRRFAYHLLLILIQWILQYEGWVDDTIGKDYRREGLARFPAAVTSAEERLNAWQRLGQFYQPLARRAPFCPPQRHQAQTVGDVRPDAGVQNI